MNDVQIFNYNNNDVIICHDMIHAKENMTEQVLCEIQVHMYINQVCLCNCF